MEQKKRVLVIEDDQDLSKALAAALEEAGFEVEAASDGEVGLRLAIANRPDAVVLDVVLPAVRGTVLLPRLREYAWGRDVKVIVISNMDDDEKRRLAEKGGALAYLVKSDTSLEKIVTTVKEALTA